jgi:hypothetical protein
MPHRRPDVGSGVAAGCQGRGYYSVQTMARLSPDEVALIKGCNTEGDLLAACAAIRARHGGAPEDWWNVLWFLNCRIYDDYAAPKVIDQAMSAAGIPRDMSILRSFVAASGLAALCAVVALFAFSEAQAIAVGVIVALVQGGMLRRAHRLQRFTFRVMIVELVQMRFSYFCEMISSGSTTDPMRRLFETTPLPGVKYPL